MVPLLPGHEHIHLAPRCEDRGYQPNVSNVPGPQRFSHTEGTIVTLYSLIGGALMAVVGIAYLIFEDLVLAEFTWTTQSTPKKPNHITRMLVGVQVGLTILSILITRSTVLSMQTRNGVPPGNQAVGWLVLGRARLVSIVPLYPRSIIS